MRKPNLKKYSSCSRRTLSFLLSKPGHFTQSITQQGINKTITAALQRIKSENADLTEKLFTRGNRNPKKSIIPPITGNIDGYIIGASSAIRIEITCVHTTKGFAYIQTNSDKFKFYMRMTRVESLQARAAAYSHFIPDKLHSTL